MTATNPAAMSDARRPGLAARLLLAAYPPAWRQRYGDEIHDTVFAMQQDGTWGFRHALDVLRGLGAAWLVPTQFGSDDAERTGTHRLIPFSAWGLLLFMLAGSGFAKLLEDPSLQGAAQRHGAITACIDVVVGCAVATAVVMAVCSVPSLVVLVRRQPRDLLPLLAVPASAGVVAAALAVAKHVAENGPQFSHTRQVVTACVLGGVTLAAAVVSTAAVMHVAVRVPASRVVELSRKVAMVSVGVLTTTSVLAVAAWVGGMAELGSVHLLKTHGGVLGTPTLPTLAVVLAALLLGATLCGASAARAARTTEFSG